MLFKCFCAMEISRKKIIRRAVREFSFLCSPSFSLMAMMSYIKFNLNLSSGTKLSCLSGQGLPDYAAT